MIRIISVSVVVIPSMLLTSCGLYVPNKHLLRADSRYTDPSNRESYQNTEGRAEANIIANLRCEIANGIYVASAIRHDGQNNTSYLRESWGTQVTLKLTWDEQSSISPGLSFIHPKANSQSRAIGLGGSASAHATRLETVTFLFENKALYEAEVKWLQNKQDNPNGLLRDCSKRETGTMIDSDLKIAEFIIDKATVASTGIATTDEPNNAPFSTFQEDITFVGAYGGDFTPTWTLTRFTANTSGKLIAGTRTVTGDVLITLGPLAQDEKGNFLHKLGDLPSAQHTAAFAGGATASQVVSQTH
jgi:hypothetical protein